MSDRPLSEHHITSGTLAECDERLRDAEVRIATLVAERDRLRELARKLLPQCSCGIYPDGICERCAALNNEGGEGE